MLRINAKAAVVVSVGLAALAGGAYALFGVGQHNVETEPSAATSELVTVNESLDQFIADFNDASGSVRTIFVVGPSCGPCLLALHKMERAVGDMVRERDDLKTFVLHVPTLGAQEHHARRAMRLMSGEDIYHYWDPVGQSGVRLRDALELDAYAWDVWLIYDRDAVWTDGNPTAPAHWEHQLGGLPRNNRLDPDRFASTVTRILNRQGDGG